MHIPLLFTVITNTIGIATLPWIHSYVYLILCASVIHVYVHVYAAMA